MSTRRKYGKSITQNTSAMACGVYESIKRSVNKLAFRHRLKLAFRILRGAW